MPALLALVVISLFLSLCLLAMLVLRSAALRGDEAAGKALARYKATLPAVRNTADGEASKYRAGRSRVLVLRYVDPAQLEKDEWRAKALDFFLKWGVVPSKTVEYRLVCRGTTMQLPPYLSRFVRVVETSAATCTRAWSAVLAAEPLGAWDYYVLLDDTAFGPIDMRPQAFIHLLASQVTQSTPLVGVDVREENGRPYLYPLVWCMDDATLRMFQQMEVFGTVEPAGFAGLEPEQVATASYVSDGLHRIRKTFKSVLPLLQSVNWRRVVMADSATTLEAVLPHGNRPLWHPGAFFGRTIHVSEALFFQTPTCELERVAHAAQLEQFLTDVEQSVSRAKGEEYRSDVGSGRVS